MPRQEPVQAAEPLTEFWAKETGASKIGNRSPDPDPLTRGDDLADHVAEDVGQPEIAAGLSGVMERFPNLTQSGGGYGRSIPWQEPCLVAQPLTEFWAKGTGASKIENRSLTPFPSASIAPRS